MKKNNFVEGTIIATAIIVIVKLLGMLYVIPFYAIVGAFIIKAYVKKIRVGHGLRKKILETYL